MKIYEYIIFIIIFLFLKKLERKKGKNPNFDKHVTRFVFFFHNFFKNKNIKTKYIFLLITKSLNKKRKECQPSTTKQFKNHHYSQTIC